MLLKIYHDKNVKNLSLIIHLTCFGELGECELKEILNNNFVLFNDVVSDSCVAKLSIKFLIPKKYKSRLVRQLNKRRLKEVISESIKQNKWAFLIRFNRKEENLNIINPTYTTFIIKCPNDFNLIETFEGSKVPKIEGSLDYHLLHDIYDTFNIIKIE